MKKKRFYKGFMAGIAAVTMAVAAVPMPTQVTAEEQQEYPDELMFPMRLLDFRADNLLFEYALATNSILTLADMNLDGVTGGTGLVETELGADGAPVYKRAVVEEIADYVNLALGKSSAETPDTNNTVLDYPGSGVEENPLSIRNYIHGETYAGRTEIDALSGTRIAELEEGTVAWKPADDTGCTVEKEADSIYQVKASDGTLLYRFNGDGIEIKSDRTVELTYTGLQGNYTVSNLWLGSDKVELLVNGRSVLATDVVSPDSNGELHLEIQAKKGTDLQSATDAEMKVAVLKLTPVEGINYPIGNYESSKSKFDGTNKGWSDITTCMDYAYFVTSNFFASQPTLNKEYNDYQSLVFEKQVDASGQISYVFCADGKHVENGGKENNKVIFNPDKKTVRNGSLEEAAANEIVKDEGSFFVCDEATKEYPTLDPNMYEHNYHFTMSSQGSFVYKEGTGQYFTFSGDDDVYMYLNGKLLMDLGGAHIEQTKDMYMDELKEEYGLVDGQVCTMDFFYMERHTTQSNFYVKTNITLASDSLDQTLQDAASAITLKKNAEVTYGSDVKLNYQFAALRPGVDNTNLTFTDSFGNMIGKDGFKLGDGVSLGTDNKIVLTVTRKNGTVETKELIFADPKNPTAEEISAVKTYFQTLKLTNGDNIRVSGMVYDSGAKEYTESVASDVTVTYDAVLLGGQSTESCTLLDRTSIKLIKDNSSTNNPTDDGSQNNTQPEKEPENSKQPDTETETETETDIDTPEEETEVVNNDRTDEPENTEEVSVSTNTDLPKSSTPSKTKVRTGDDNNWYLPLVSLVASAGVIVGMVWKRRKKA